MSMVLKLVIWVRGFCNTVLEWNRDWPQTGLLQPPRWYTKVYLPSALVPPHKPGESGGTWSDLEEAGVFRLADDWQYSFFCPVALPAGWWVSEHIGLDAVLYDQFTRMRATIRYALPHHEPVMMGESTITLTGRYCIDFLYAPDYDGLVGIVLDRDTTGIVYRTGVCKWIENAPFEAVSDTATAQATQWMDANHPGWRSYNYHRPNE